MERHGSRETMLDSLVVVRKDLNIYEKVETSSKRDRWVRARTSKLQSFHEKLK